MPGRWFHVVVVLFWLCSMSWLVATKVMPPFQIGEPPNYQALLPNGGELPPVCWLVRWRDEPLGWAASRVTKSSEGMTAVEGQIFLERLPLEEMAPGWLGAVIKPLLRQSSVTDTATAAVTHMDIDPLNRLVSFESRLSLAQMMDPIRIAGHVDGNQLRLTVTQSGEVRYKEDRYLPSGALLGDQLSPQSTLPSLHLGQRWTMPLYNPFRPPKNSIEILQAEVERKEVIFWNGASTPTLQVVYRDDSGASLASHREARSKLWVRADGLVLKQEMVLFNSPLWFVRLTPRKGILAAEAIGEWQQCMPTERAAALLKSLVE